MKKLISRWYLVIVFGFILFAGLMFVICGENSIIAVHDNLDLFIPQFQMMKNTGTFWAHEVDVPFLGGISRDVLPAEFSLYTILYMILPSYPAYIVGYLLKILIALFSCVFLAKDMYEERYERYRPLVYLLGLAYGVLNVFPAFGIPFASIPLVICLVRKIYRQPSVKWYAALFFYPILSYFSYFGLFILAYMAVAFIWLWIRDKKFPGRILLSICILSAGCIACEYRLFGTMLLGDEVTIRSTMEAGSFNAKEIIRTIGEVLTKGMFHAESMHTYLVLPVCIIYFLFLNISYIKDKNAKGIFHDLYNLLMLILVFNSIIYGIYYWEGFRNVVETICPPLTGWQFNRTVFFSPFIWYSAFFLVLKRLYDSHRKYINMLANLLAVSAVLIIILSGTRYNDLYHTCFSQAYSLVKGEKIDQLNYEEFYSVELFEKAKEEIGYQGEWSAAYGFYPAILEYSGISTLDGYLGFYAQSYKEDFRKIIAPALDRMEESRDYFDSWGARAYLYSGTDVSIVNAFRSYSVTDHDIYIDVDAFKALGGKFIFSRIELTNEEEAGLELTGVYTHEKSPYTLYVYQTAGREPAQIAKPDEQIERIQIDSFEDMKNLTYDRELLEEQVERLTYLAREADETQTADKPEEVTEAYEKIKEELTKLSTCYSIAQINYYQDIYSEENRMKQEEIFKDVTYIEDEVLTALKAVCNSPYREAMENVMEPWMVDAIAGYEEKTDREKEITLQENALIQEYERALDKGNGNNCGEIFLELVQLRNEEAALNGYDDYAEYAYLELYMRDYTIDETERLLDEVWRKVVPVIDDMYEVSYANHFYSVFDTERESTGKELLESMQPYLDEISPKLGESMEHLLAYELYDMDEKAHKADVGFTIDLPYFQDAFIFINPYGDVYDYTQAIHEFGHYNQMYRNTEGVLEEQDNIDVSEIHSQGLEMLYYNFYDDMFGPKLGDAVRFMQVYTMAESLADAARISEFEIEVYKHPDMTLEEIDRLYLDISEKYGFYYDGMAKDRYVWFDISHIYNAPCYYVSYLTSAFSSLDLLTVSEENWREASEIYMNLTELSSDVAYCDAVEQVGLRDIFENGVPEEIIRETADIIQVYN